MRRTWVLVGLGAVVACGTSEVLRNGGFDLWCGEELCAWEIELGAVEKAPTWHEQEYGVALLGDRTILSQVLGLDRFGARECMELALTHRGGADDPLEVTLDLMDDGTDELVWQVPPSNFDRKTVFFQLPSWFEAPRLRITKHDGQVVLGQAALTSAAETDCREPPLSLQDRPAGAPCEAAADCADGACTLAVVLGPDAVLGPLQGEVCAECASDADCDELEVCGAATDPEPRFGVPRSCVEPGARALGELCATDGECATGTCCDGACAECCSDRACDDAAAVCQPQSADVEGLTGPRMCVGPLREAGSACLLDGDCASGACDAAEPLRVCQVDGRRCEVDDDCRQTPLGARYERTCVEVGALNGTCL